MRPALSRQPSRASVENISDTSGCQWSPSDSAADIFFLGLFGQSASSKSVMASHVDEEEKSGKALDDWIDEAVARALAEAARKHAESEGRGVVASPMAGKDPITGKLCLAPCVDGRIVTRNPVENIGA